MWCHDGFQFPGETINLPTKKQKNKQSKKASTPQNKQRSLEEMCAVPIKKQESRTRAPQTWKERSALHYTSRKKNTTSTKARHTCNEDNCHYPTLKEMKYSDVSFSENHFLDPNSNSNQKRRRNIQRPQTRSNQTYACWTLSRSSNACTPWGK
jgi:hypothetical protein